ncbi:MAG: hypothetical protein OEX97_10950 [Acidimicrobiia bacterium]|nr:hypothetical protein [Acidimicrobiia bacterium]
MTIDERLRTELQMEDSALPDLVGSLDGTLRRGRRLRRRSIANVALGSVIVAVAVIGIVGYSLPRLPDTQVHTMAGEAPGGNVELVGVNFSYSNRLHDSPEVFAGTAAPEPLFDTSILGTEIPLVEDFEAVDLDDLNGPTATGPMLYGGSVAETPVFVFQGAMGPLEEFLDLLEDGHHDGSLCFVGLKAHCLRPGERISIGMGGTGGGPDRVPREWSFDGLVGEDVAVVSVTVNDVASVWQRPVSGLFSLPFAGVPGDSVALVLYTADGQPSVGYQPTKLPE